jgi:mannose-6-phosphate isomerase-like protein (cupin superfamily)
MLAQRDERHTGYVVPARGLTVALPHELYTFVALSDETRRAHTVCKVLTAPGAGRSAHAQADEDEAWLILVGRYAIQLAERTHEYGPGALVVAPRGMVRSYRNVGQTTGKLLYTVWPGGEFEQRLMAVGQVLAPDLAMRIMEREYAAWPGSAYGDDPLARVAC